MLYLVLSGLLAGGAAAPLHAQSRTEAAPEPDQNCRMSLQGAKCMVIPEAQRTRAEFAEGDEFPVYEYNMLMNVTRYGLPPVDGPWRYYQVGHVVYRVDAVSFKVLEVILNARLN
ncbi:MAG: hypothetical protein R3D84_13805 [Paracoccaceae bacterium]